MSTYVIGDVQGCFDELQRLLDSLHFDPSRDRIWFTGDLVNRGPKSLQALRLARELDAVSVLGNHDLHLLAVSEGIDDHQGDSDTLGPILAAHDRDELLTWLRRRPLLHHDAELGFVMIHAGLPPQWDLASAKTCAAEVEAVLRGPDYREFFANMYGNEPDRWPGPGEPPLTGMDRLRFIVNCFTRLRYCSPDGHLALKAKGAPGTQPEGTIPWFEIPERASRDTNIVFGHWSTLGYYAANGIWALDTGCLWGGQLTALRLGPDPVALSVDCPEARRPGYG
ncbi:MAG TPA: symmetrical bis(5'-nucleosyl)-tetraphosphatase [Gammaproteobacteria bacterium]|nr:symmetrical bis(5'-nucleosyl)-tetraphosphatase [Gammaproteobacteria bacterium]